MEDLKSLKKTYQMMKSKGDMERSAFLDGIVSYCKYINFDKVKTMMMLGLIRNFCPEPGQKFTECDPADEFDNNYTKKILDEFKDGEYGMD